MASSTTSTAIHDEGRGIVLNHPRPSTLVSRTDAEDVVERPMQVEIGYDGPRFDKAAITGEVLVVADPTSTAAKGIMKLAAAIAEEYRTHTGTQ